MNPAFVVTGTGRCGTGYIAAVLTACGVPCGHEAAFNPTGSTVSGLLGDSSWCALAVLHGYAGRVFQQVREPLAVVSSLVHVELHTPYRELSEAICGPLPPDPIERAVCMYVRCNELAERHAELRWQVERVTAELIEHVAHRLCMRVPAAVAAHAIELVPNTVNQHVELPALSWGDLPDIELTGRLLAMAERYDYPTP